MRTPIEALKEIRDRLTYFCLRTDGKYDPPWATELVGIIDDILKYKKNTGNPFYVDIGTSVVAIRCSSNHDVVHRLYHAYNKGSIEYLEQMCARMNEEALGVPWHHSEMEELILRHEKEVAELKKLIPQPDPDWKAICEKCHDGDIEPDCEYYGEPNGCNSPIYGEHPKEKPVGNAAARDEMVLSKDEYKGMQEALSEHDRLCEMLSEYRKAVGNAAAMREALVEISKIADDWSLYANTKAGALDRIYELANAALSAPPRNCDIPSVCADPYKAYLDDEKNWDDEWGIPKREIQDWILAPAEEGAEA